MNIYRFFLLVFLCSCNKHFYFVDKDKLFNDLKKNEFYVKNYKYEYPLMLQSNNSLWSDVIDILFVAFVSPFFNRSYIFSNQLDTLICYDNSKKFYLNISKSDKMVIKSQNKNYYLNYIDMISLYLYEDTLFEIKNYTTKYYLKQNKKIKIPLNKIDSIKIRVKHKKLLYNK